MSETNFIAIDPEVTKQAYLIAQAISSVCTDVFAEASGDTVTITSTLDGVIGNEIELSCITNGEALELSDAHLTGGSDLVPATTAPIVVEGTVFTVWGDPTEYIIIQDCYNGELHFAPPSKQLWTAGSIVTVGAPITQGSQTIYTLTQDASGTVINFTPPLDTTWLRGTKLSWLNDTVDYKDSKSGKLYFLPTAVSPWPVGTTLSFGVDVVPITQTCDRTFESCINYGNEKRYCGFPTTGGRSITI